MARAFLENDVRWDAWDYLAFVLQPLGWALIVVLVLASHLRDVWDEVR